MRGWLDALLPEAKDNGVSGHPGHRGAMPFNTGITQPTIIPFITQPTIYRVIVYALPCHSLASTTHFTELSTNQQLRLCHAYDATHVNVNLIKTVWYGFDYIPWPMSLSVRRMTWKIMSLLTSGTNHAINC